MSLINPTLQEVDPEPHKTSKTKFFIKTVKGLKAETIITKNSISDAAEILDTLLAIFYFADF